MKKPFDGNFVQLAREMDDATRSLESMPDDQEWTVDQIEDMEEVRWRALRLSEEVEATIKTFEGRIA